MKRDNTALAELRGVGSVSMCDCGSINLTLGAVTLHLDADTFLKSSFMLHSAAEQLMDLKSATMETTGAQCDSKETGAWSVN